MKKILKLCLAFLLFYVPPKTNAQSLDHPLTLKAEKEIKEDIEEENVDDTKGDKKEITSIYYLFKNLQPALGGGFTFDIFSHVRRHKQFAEGTVICRYDTAMFGSDIIALGHLTVSLSTNLSPYIYTLTAADAGPGKVKIKITSTGVAASHFRLTNIPQQILKCEINGVVINPLITSASYAFDSAAMQHESKFIKANNNLVKYFDKVFVTNNLRSDGDSINFSIANVVLDGTQTHLDFDVIGSATDSGVYVGEYTVKVNFDPNAFDGAVVINTPGNGDNSCMCGGNGCCGGDSIYSFAYAFVPGSVTFSLQPNDNYDYDIVDSDEVYNQIFGQTVIGHVTLHISDCHYPPAVSIDPSSFAQWDDIDIGSLLSYDPTYIGPGYYDTMCTPVPQVYDWYPHDCISAGSFQVVTINGLHFGHTAGTVYFNNANNPGTFIHTLPPDIRSWSDSFISLLIPSALSPDPTLGTAGSGVFYVQTAGGLDNSADSVNISIAHADYNIRDTAGVAHFVYLRDTTYIFYLSSSLFLTTGVEQAVESVFADLKCQTGIDFQYGGLSPVDTPANDGINVISMQPNSSHVFLNASSSVLAVTLPYTKHCSTGLSQYNDNASYATDIDITFRSTPPAPGIGWNWWLYLNPLYSLVYDAPSVLYHELGHAAMLGHALPEKPDSQNIMYPSLAMQQVQRSYDYDYNTIIGVKYTMSLGDTLGNASTCLSMIPSFPDSCPTVNPATCEDIYYTGIHEVGSSPGFNASLYPNPYQDNTIVHVDVWSYADFSITMYDVVGHIISQRNISSSIPVDIPLSDFKESAGVYLIQVSDSHTKKILKLIKL
jgi:hypothetical protein